MKTIDEYLDHVRQLIQSVAQAHIERYEEQILSANRINLRIRLRFSDQALLEISEAVVFIPEKPVWLSYRYHYQDPFTNLIFRYDNTPHHPEISTHPDHKHIEDNVLASSRPSIEQVLLEVESSRNRAETGAET